jgi:flagellar FliL protein
MAETNDNTDNNATAGGKSKKMLIIIVAALLIIAGGAAFFLMGGEDEAASQETTEAKPIKQAAIYHTVEKPFVINFSEQSANRVKYMQVKLKVMARDQAAIDGFKLHMPAIQHELLMLFFSQNYDAMNTKEGTQALRKEALKTINDLLTAEKQAGLLEAVYFTSLIMQ